MFDVEVSKVKVPGFGVLELLDRLRTLHNWLECLLTCVDLIKEFLRIHFRLIDFFAGNHALRWLFDSFNL